MANLDANSSDALVGAVYFVVGMGTEGGPASYKLSIAGITPHNWGAVRDVIENSGYSIGASQVDLGQRGTWPLGAAEDRALLKGEQTYVDAIIQQSSDYAKDHHLPFPKDTKALRSDLLSHGRHLQFIDTHTRDSIDAWASSEDGRKWIHANVDFPQVNNITQEAAAIVDKYPEQIPVDRRLEAICLIAKTENQLPTQVKTLEKSLERGGDYNDLRETAIGIHNRHHKYAGLTAVSVAVKYQEHYSNPAERPLLERAATEVASKDYDPLFGSRDPAVQEALAAVGISGHSHAHTKVLRQHDHGAAVRSMQDQLSSLGYTGADGKRLVADSDFGLETRHAVEHFQRDHRLAVDGVAGLQTQRAIESAVRHAQEVAAAPQECTNPFRLFSDPAHPQYPLYATLKDIMPPASEARLTQATAACYMSGMRRPEDLGDIFSTDSNILAFQNNSMMGHMAQLDLTQPVPSVQQTMQQVQAYDHQQAHLSQQVQQSMAQQQGMQGPVPGMPMH